MQQFVAIGVHSWAPNGSCTAGRDRPSPGLRQGATSSRPYLLCRRGAVLPVRQAQDDPERGRGVRPFEKIPPTNTHESARMGRCSNSWQLVCIRGLRTGHARQGATGLRQGYGRARRVRAPTFCAAGAQSCPFDRLRMTLNGVEGCGPLKRYHRRIPTNLHEWADAAIRGNWCAFVGSERVMHGRARPAFARATAGRDEFAPLPFVPQGRSLARSTGSG